MKCPYCGVEMELALIQSAQEICWIPGEDRKMFARAGFHEGAVVLSKLSFMKGSAVTAYLCRTCRKVVIDCADGPSDKNG